MRIRDGVIVRDRIRMCVSVIGYRCIRVRIRIRIQIRIRTRCIIIIRLTMCSWSYVCW